MRAFVVVMIAGVTLAAAQARGQVAVAATIADGDVVQRHIAGAIVLAVSDRWQVLPPLPPRELARCTAGDTGCLRRVAEENGGSHLLLIGMAPIGFRDVIVAVQLFDVASDRALFEESTVQAGGDLDKLGETHLLVARLLNTAGPRSAERAAKRTTQVVVKPRQEVVLQPIDPTTGADAVPYILSAVAVLVGIGEIVGPSIWLATPNATQLGKLESDISIKGIVPTVGSDLPNSAKPDFDPGGKDWNEAAYGGAEGRELAFRAYRHAQYWQIRGGHEGSVLLIVSGAVAIIVGGVGLGFAAAQGPE